jgi:hypothetical protein
VTLGELHTRKYCSHKCRGKAQRSIPEADIIKAIELRDAGWTWGRIEAELGRPPQSLLRRIGTLLRERGELTEERVVELLRDRRGRKHVPRWGWLLKGTGLRPEPREAAIPRPEPLAGVA